MKDVVLTCRACGKTYKNCDCGGEFRISNIHSDMFIYFKERIRILKHDCKIKELMGLYGSIKQNTKLNKNEKSELLNMIKLTKKSSS